MCALLAPSLYVAHGAGPMPLFDDPVEKDISRFLRDDARRILIRDATIKAIIVVTAHWEASGDAYISSAAHHDLLYDYNFWHLPEAYKLKYDAPGAPDLARRIHEAFRENGVRSRLDDDRGWDHGTFVPMLLINPQADLPIVQVSILANHSAEAHWNMGKALGKFKKEGVAILGSGLSYHNVAMLDVPPNVTEIVNVPFDEFLDSVCEADESERKDLLLRWREQEGAYESHPRGQSDHFMPFIVNAGAAGDSKCTRVFTSVYRKNFRIGAFSWG